MKKHRKILISLLILFVLLFNLIGCMAPSIDGLVIPGPDPEDVSSTIDLLANVEKSTVTEVVLTDEFLSNQMSLAIKLFKESGKITGNDNLLVSPLSIQLAFAMLANGARGNTLKELEALLGDKIGINQLNSYLYTYINTLPSEEKAKLQIANSIWFRSQGFVPNQEFLETNKSYYDSELYKAPFDNSTVDDINSWVNENTDGMIKKVLDEIGESSVMYLLNAIMFDAEWQNQYTDSDVFDSTFYASDGIEYDVEMMMSEESAFIQLKNSIGFKKRYKNGYSFVALLPNEKTISEFIDSLDENELLNAINNPSYDKRIFAKMPKFEYSYEANLKMILNSLGVNDAFNMTNADLTGLGKGSGNLYVSDAIHKTFISVAEQGTRAGAVTMIDINDESAILDTREIIEITLDRPFVYMIVDNQTGLPIFMGTLTNLK